MSHYEQITSEMVGAVAIVTLNRPDKLNALTPLMEKEVAAALATAAQDRSVRAVVFTGAGRGFCSGADLSAAAAAREGERLPPRPGPNRFAFLWNFPKPLFAAINGPAAGVGLSIALHCDFRCMAEGAFVTTAFAHRGLIAEHGSAWLLPRLIGVQHAADLLFSGRKVAAAEAAAMGLVRLLPDEGFLPAVLRIASDLVAQSSPRSVKVMKQQIHEALSQTFDDALITADREQAESLQSADFREGVAAFRERRPSSFTGE
jgi:enoyl-CoA hydratase/carnithine racemase